MGNIELHKLFSDIVFFYSFSGGLAIRFCGLIFSIFGHFTNTEAIYQCHSRYPDNLDRCVPLVVGVRNYTGLLVGACILVNTDLNKKSILVLSLFFIPYILYMSVKYYEMNTFAIILPTESTYYSLSLEE